MGDIIYLRKRVGKNLEDMTDDELLEFLLEE